MGLAYIAEKLLPQTAASLERGVASRMQQGEEIDREAIQPTRTSYHESGSCCMAANP